METTRFSISAILKLDAQALAHFSQFDRVTGKLLSAFGLAARPPYPYIQKIIYVPKVTQEQKTKSGRVRPSITFDYPYKQRPFRLYSFDSKPTPPFQIKHGINGYIETSAYDYSIQYGKFNYHSRFFNDGGVWVILEFLKEPELKPLGTSL